MLNFNYSVTLLLEYAAFFKLRIDRSDLERPYRIPLSTWRCAILFFPSIAFTVIVMSLATFTTFGFAFGSYCTGLILYFAKTSSERQKLRSGIAMNAGYEIVESLDTSEVNGMDSTELA